MNFIEPQDHASCIICGAVGERFYENLADHFLGEGEFVLKYCSSCALFWLQTRPLARDIIDSQGVYFEGENIERRIKRPFAGLRDTLRELIICGYYGYNSIHKEHKFCRWGRCLGAIPALRSRAIYGMGELFPLRSKNHAAPLIVDVGCGEGDYLKMMQGLGWRVLGIEPNPLAASHAESKGIPVFRGILQEANLSDSTADQITMNHVLEHLPDPFTPIKESFRVLKPAGRLIMHTPNAQALGHKIFKRNWYGLDAPRHMFIFSLKSIRLILQKTPFKKFRIKTLTSHSRTIYDNSLLFSKFGRISNRGVRPQKFRSFFALLETMLCSLGMDCGEEIEVVAFK